ncbi:MAG: hypothetical protein KGM99_11900, partial [Burkholderiales bacterium]|nr:hypothetical protein [Burkholderiales bacterium]
MAEERIDSLFDVPAILKERDTVLAAMKSITDEMAKSTVEASKQKSVLTDAKTAKEAAAAINQVDAETKKLSNSTKKLTDEQRALERLNKTLVRAQVQQSEAGQKVVNALDRERAELKAISFERQKAIQQERSQADYTRAFAKELDLASMNISEMQKELSRLNAMSFKGLDAKQIAHVKGQMALLTEEIGDQRKAIAASGDKFNVMVGALQGLVGVTQLVTGTMSMFGVENKRLEKTMIQLIGISQGLTAIHDMHEKAILKNAAATIKDAFAKAAATISTKAYAMATGGATTATRLLGKAMMTIPFIAIAAAIVGLVIAVGKMANAYKEAGSMAKLMEDVQTKQHEIAADEIVQLGTLERRLIATKDNKKEYAKVVKEYNETIGNKYNASLKETANSFDDITRAAFTARVAIMENAAAQAAADKMKELVSKNFDEYLVYMDAQVKVQELRVKKMQQLEDNAKMRFESTEEMEAFFRNQINYDKLISETYEAAGVSSKLAYEFDRLMALGAMYSKQTAVVTSGTKTQTTAV